MCRSARGGRRGSSGARERNYRTRQVIGSGDLSPRSANRKAPRIATEENDVDVPGFMPSSWASAGAFSGTAIPLTLDGGASLELPAVVGACGGGGGVGIGVGVGRDRGGRSGRRQTGMAVSPTWGTDALGSSRPAPFGGDLLSDSERVRPSTAGFETIDIAVPTGGSVFGTAPASRLGTADSEALAAPGDSPDACSEPPSPNGSVGSDFSTGSRREPIAPNRPRSRPLRRLVLNGTPAGGDGGDLDLSARTR